MMERLTKRTNDGKVGYALIGPGECVDVIDLLHVWGDRLAAYEDTELSPETASDLLDRFCYFYRTVEGLDLIDHVHFGAFVDRVSRWAQAEKDGRLVVLPCKIGDTVYIIRDKKIIIAAAEAIHQWISGNWKLSVHTDKRYTHWVGYEVSFDDFGKTAFLTREEAEAALKKREEADKFG